MFARLVPGPLVRLFARPYVAGGSLDDGLDVARRLLGDDLILSSLDLLGESVTERGEIEDNVRTYRQLIDGIAAEPRFVRSGYRPWGSAFPTVSLKPSAFTTGPLEDATAPIEALARYAAERSVGLTIDMEDRHFTDYTLDLAVGLFEQGLDVGTVLQTRLHRTERDLARIPTGMRLRLVIGIYPEPEDVALTAKPEMKLRMLEHATRLLDQGCRVEFATHDEPTLERFLREVAPAAPDRCEIQMLLGVPRERFIRRMRALEFGLMLPIRLYVPFARDWEDATAYLRRRMGESPSMVWLVLRNLLPRRR
jgi:proline dehydrogenase